MISFNRPSKRLAFFAVFAVISIVVMAVGAHHYLLNHTTYPLWGAVRGLQAEGYVVTGLSGNVQEGFRVESVQHESANATFKLSQLKFNVQPAGPLAKKLMINQLTASEAVIRLRSWDLADSVLGDFTLDSANLGSVELSLPDQPKLKLDRTQLTQLSWSRGELRLGRLSATGSQLDFEMQDLSGNVSRMTLGHPIRALIKPAMFPGVLKEPVDIELNASIAGKQLRTLSMSAFSKSLTAEFENGGLEVVFADFSPAKYFDTELPMSELNLEISGDPRTFALDQATGSVRLRDKKFDLQSTFFANNECRERCLLIPKTFTDWKSLLNNAKPAWVLTSASGQDARATLAGLYFGRTIDELSLDEAALVAADMRFFDSLERAPLRRPTSNASNP